jgi:hypothetical protein
MRKILLTAGAIALLVVGVGVASAANLGTSEPAAKAIVEPAFGPDGEPGAVLHEVLSDLVTKGTITQAQADAITAALEAKREAFQAERQKVRETMKTILEDGVITKDELAQLPADHPLNQLDNLLDDGKITLDELRALGPMGGLGRHGGHGPGFFGPGGPDANDDSRGGADGTSAG